MRIIIGLAVLLTLCCCVKPPVWNHEPPVTQVKFKHDLARCNVMGRQMASGAEGFYGLALFMQERDMCMEGEGYVQDND